MANRIVYKVSNLSNKYVDEIEVDFKWHPGLAKIQKQKSVFELHSEFKKLYSNYKILEVSSKSEVELGIKLSAFNLMITDKQGKKYSVESAFQSSKKFEYGGPYIDILNKESIESKRDERLKSSGELKAFIFYGREWSLEPKNLFYDWVYIRALYKQRDLARLVLDYDAFTDIEFNPLKSYNCQAKAVALFVALKRRNLLDYAMESIKNYEYVITRDLIEEKNNQTTFFDY